MSIIQIIALIVLLQASGEQQPDAKDYDDWLGAREFVLDDDEPSSRKANGIWDGEED